MKEFIPDYRRYTDVTIIVHEYGDITPREKIEASKAVLSAYSDYFYKLFSGAIGNTDIKETKIYVESAFLFPDLLEALYDGELYDLILGSSCEESLALLRMCSRLEINVKYKKLLNQISISNEYLADFIRTIEETLGDPKKYLGLIGLKLRDENINLNSLENGELKNFLQDVKKTSNSLLIIAEGNRISLWNFATGDIEKKYYLTSPASSLSLSPSGTLIVVGTSKEPPLILDLLSSIVKPISHNGEIVSLTFSHDGQKIASINTLGLIKIHNPNGECLQKIEDFRDCSNCSLIFLSDNKRLLVACREIFKMWDMETKNLLWISHVNSIANVSVSSDDANIAYISQLEGLSILDAKTGSRKIMECQKEESLSENFVLFSPDNLRLALATDKAIKIYNIKTWEPLLEIPTPNPDNHAEFLAFSSSGSNLASVNKKGEVMIQDSFTGELLSQFQYTINSANFVLAFSPLSK